jgi:hypothetical protein
VEVVGRTRHHSNVNHRIRCRISNTYRYMTVFIGREKKMEIVRKKNWVAVAVLQLRLRLLRCWWCMGVYRNMPKKKKCRELRLRWSFACYVLRLLCITRGEENMSRSSEFVVERWMMKNDSRDRKTDRNGAS